MFYVGLQLGDSLNAGLRTGSLSDIYWTTAANISWSAGTRLGKSYADLRQFLWKISAEHEVSLKIYMYVHV